jgi:hypothetical protein
MSTHTLDKDCWLHVFHFLDIKSRVLCERVCRDWNDTALRAHLTQTTLMTEHAIGSLMCRRLPHNDNGEDLFYQTKSPAESSSQLGSCLNPNIIPISLLNEGERQRSMLSLVLSKTPNLQDIDLSCPQLMSSSPASLLSLIVSSLPRLVSLSISCPNQRPSWSSNTYTEDMTRAIQGLCNSQPLKKTLRRLRIPFPDELCVSLVFESFPLLENIDVSGQGISLTPLSLQFTPIALQSFTGSYSMTPEGSSVFCSRVNQSLTKLSIDQVTPDSMVSLLSSLPLLNHLSISLCPDFSCRQEDFESFGCQRNLKTLIIKSINCKHFDGSLLTIMIKGGFSSSLQEMRLHGFLLSDLSVSFTHQYFPRLKQLVVGKTLSNLSTMIPGITNESLKSLSRLRNLEILDIESPNRVTADGVCAFFKTVTNSLRFFRFWDCKMPTITASSLESLYSFCTKSRQRIANPSYKDVITVYIDHPRDVRMSMDSGCNPLDDDDFFFLGSSTLQKRNPTSYSPHSYHLQKHPTIALNLLSEFHSKKPQNLNFVVKVGSQCLVLEHEL